jgi:hypothetical protein
LAGLVEFGGVGGRGIGGGLNAGVGGGAENRFGGLALEFFALEEEAVALEFGALAKAPGFGVAVHEGRGGEETAAEAVEGFIVIGGGRKAAGRMPAPRLRRARGEGRGTMGGLQRRGSFLRLRNAVKLPT